MKILFVTPYLASPPQCGAQRRLEGLMRGLAVRHEVSLLSFATPADSAPERTHSYCKQVTTVERDVLKVPAAFKRALQFRSMLTRHSFEHMLYSTRAFQQRLDQHIAHGDYDVVQVEFAQMGIYSLSRTPGQRTRFVLDEHNIEYEIVKRTAEAEGSAARRIYSAINWRKVKHEELDAWRRFDGVALTSQRDEELLKRDAPGIPTRVVPNAVDLDEFRPNATQVEPNTLLFFGALDYHPNVEGMQYFLAEIWPLLTREHPQVKLVVVGRNPPPTLLSRRGPQVEFTGYVDDPRPYLDSAAAVIVPLRIGGGTRFKIVEAMAKAKPIISTTIGAEGLNAENERHLLIGDDPSSFAKQAGRVLRDPAFAATIGGAARQFAERQYGWQSAVEKLESFFAELR
jgi:glycosyltransferase involved in cell wall biosynthesis